MSPPNSSPKDELKILTPVGMLGYSFSESLFWSALEEGGFDAIIADSGSTDSGPSKLAFGRTTVTREAYERDLSIIVAACSRYRIPVLIGTAGGDGANAHVDMFFEIIAEIVQQKSLRKLNVIRIYSEIEKGLIRQKHVAGQIRPCGKAVPVLTMQDIDDPPRIVAQMGLEPYVKAMRENPDFDIIVGGRAYDPAPYAAFCMYHGFTDLGITYHMGKLMECGALCAVPKSKEAVAIVRKDSFDIRPLNPTARCTTTSVASHTLYEKTRPDVLLGPGGALCLHEATYEPLPDNRTVRVRGGSFKPEEKYTIKLEGARPCGYQSIFIGGVRDPILISQIDVFIDGVRAYVKGLVSFPYDLKFHLFGKNAVMGALEPGEAEGYIPREIGISGQARAKTQAEATHVINIARIACMHGPYPNQKATSGNFAMPYMPADIPMGELSEFCVYHLMPVDDPTSLFAISKNEVSCTNYQNGLKDAARHGDQPSEVLKSKGSSKQRVTPSISSPVVGSVNGLMKATVSKALSPSPPNGFSYLGDLASVIRSKNAGPYELTFDVMFDSNTLYQNVKLAGVLSAGTIARLYHISENDIIVCLFWDQAKAFKATIRRAAVSGGFGDSDVMGAAQHAPLMYLLLPFEFCET